MVRRWFYKQSILFPAILCSFYTIYSQKTISSLRDDLEKATSSKAKADICYSISKAYEAGMKVDSSLFFANKIKELSLEGNYETGLGMHYLAVGGALRIRNKLKESEDNSRKAIDIFSKVKNPLFLGLAYQQLAAVHQLDQKYELSRKNYRIAMHYSGAAADENSLGRQYYEMGKSFHQTFEIDSAVYYLTRSLEIAEKLKDKSRIFNSSGYLGSVFLSIDEPEKSIKYLDYALNNQPPAVSKVILRIRLLDLGESLIMVNEYARADSVLSVVAKMNEALKDTWGQANLSKLRGVYELSLKNYPQALIHLRNAYQDRAALGSFTDDDVKNIAFQLGVVEYESGLYDSSIIHIREAVRIARQLKYLKEEIYGYQLISKVFEKKSMPDSALYYLLSYDILKDYLMTNEKAKTIIEVSAKYESEKKEQEIRILQKESEANSLLLQLKNQQIEKQELEDIKKLQQLSLISQQNEISKLDASQKTLSLDNAKKENEKNQSKLKLLEQETTYQKLLALKQNQQKNIVLISIAIILTLSGFGIYRYIRRKKLQNQQQVLNERLRISRELHDEIGSTLSGIAMYGHLTKKQIKTSQTEEVERSLNNILQSAGEMMNKLSDIVWLVNPEKDSFQKLIERLEEFAINLARTKNIEMKINLPDKLHRMNIPVETRRDIYLFCKEAINNAVKYSEAEMIELTMRETENKKIEILVADNGHGFNAATVKKGNGLMNMQQRAEQVNGIFSLLSSPGEGTKISLSFKIT